MGLILIAIAEMIGAQSGLGYMIWNAWELLSVETMYVGLLVIALLGFLFTLALNELERWIVPWRLIQPGALTTASAIVAEPGSRFAR